MIIIKDAEELEYMRAAGRATARVCGEVVRNIVPGMTTKEINDFAAQLMADMGVKSAFLGYRGYPGTICVSVNEEVVHGLPGPRRICTGDIVSIDVGVEVDGFVGDMATTVAVGVSDVNVLRLLAVTEQALRAGIANALAGRHLGDISHAVETTAKSAGFSVVREFVGHGIGRRMHEEPQVPNFGRAGTGPQLRSGMTLAIEPMMNMGGAAVEVLNDGWTVVTQDRQPSAHFEHTVAVGEGKAEILTQWDGDI